MSEERIIPKKSSVVGRAPAPEVLSVGELAINVGDRKLYSKDALDNVFEIGGQSFKAVITGNNTLYPSADSSSLTIVAGPNLELESNTTTSTLTISSPGSDMGFTDKTHSTITFNSTTRTFTIAPAVGYEYFEFWNQGKVFRKYTSESVTIPNTTGVYWFYYDNDGVLNYKAALFTVFSQETSVSYIYWNATTSTAVITADERHGVEMDWATHEYLHRTRGAVMASGLAATGYTTAGDGSSNTHAQISFSNGIFFDEDLKISITHSATPTQPFEQFLSPYARLPIFYRSGASGEWTKINATDYPIHFGTSRIQYNRNNGSQWVLEDIPDKKFLAMWIVATNNIYEPLIAIVGQRFDDNQTQAINNALWENLALDGLPLVEFRRVCRVLYEADNAFTNAVDAVVRYVTDLRELPGTSTTTSGGAGANDHGELLGLSDDDHTQYVHISTARTITASHTFNPSVTGPAFSLGASANNQLIVGLNADKLDGLESSQLLRNDTNGTLSANLTITGILSLSNTGVISALNLNNNDIAGVNKLTFNDPGPNEGIEWAGGNVWRIYESPNDLTTNSSGNLQFVQNTSRRFTIATDGEVYVGTNKVFHEGNDGTGSNLDADLLDGQHGSYYTNATNISTGTLNTARLGTGTANSDTVLYGNNTWAPLPSSTGTNLSSSANAISVIVASDSGVDATINAANSTAAGVMTAADRTKLDGIAVNANTGSVTSVATGNGLTGGPITTSGTVSVLANSGIVANSTGVFVNANSGLIANSTGVFVNAATASGLTANSTGLHFRPGSGLFANTTAVYVNASAIAVGTVPTARLATGGTANSQTFLSGDQTYKTAITSITLGNGLTGGTGGVISTTGTISVVANNGISANGTGIFVNASSISIGTLGAAYGGTGLSSFNDRGILYASNTTALTTSSDLVYAANGLGIGVSTAAVTSKLTVDGAISGGQGSKLTFIGLDINSSATPTYIKIKTTIPFTAGSSDFTINIKGFVYGNSEIADLHVTWHYYAGAFYGHSVTSSGSWAPTVRLSVEGGNVAIVLSSPNYWPKLYVESMYSSAYAGQYANGWTWVDEDATGTNVTTLYYKANFGSGFVMNSSGQVGIGTSAPGAQLQVGASSTTAELIRLGINYDTARSDRGGILWRDGTNTTARIATEYDGSVASIVFGSLYDSGYNSNNLMWIRGNGRVSIGTSTPQNKFDVYTPSGIAASFGGAFGVGSFSGVHFGYYEPANTLYRKSALIFERTDNNSQGGNASGKIHFLLNNNGSTSATALTDAVFTIDSDASGTVGTARVGIQNRNPAYPLDVSGTTRLNTLIVNHTYGSTREQDGLGLVINGNYTNGQYSHRFRKWDEGGGVALWLQATGATANVWSNKIRFGGITGDSNELHVYGGTQVSGRLITSLNSRTNYYTGSNIEVFTSDNTPPSIGFHRGGYSATALYEDGGELYVNAWIAKDQTGKLISTGNYTLQPGVLRAAGSVTGSNQDWSALGNLNNVMHQVNQENFNEGTGIGNVNFPANASYKYGLLMSLSANATNSAQAQIYISHAGNDLIFRGGWYGSSWQTWNKVLTDQNYISIYAPRYFNNMGQNHGTYTNFNDVPGYGFYYVQAGTNSPTGIASHQWYGVTLGLGNDYAYSSYASQLYWPRRAQNSDTYLYVRDREGTWTSWTKIKSGYADSADYSNLTNKTAGTGTYTTSGDYRAPIFYDSDNTGYYINPTSTTSIRTVGSWRADSSSWDGEFSGKIQYHANHWYIQGADLFIFRNSSGSNVIYGDQSGNHWAIASSRSPYFYDSDNTAYYTDPAGVSNIATLKLNTSGSSASSRNLTIKASGQSEINFGSYPGTWSSALQIQNNDNTRLIWFGSPDSSYNARLRTAGGGLDIYTDGTTGDTGTRSLAVGSGSIYTSTVYDLDDSNYYLNLNGSIALYSDGAVVAGNQGFYSRYYSSGARNRIWSFYNADGYGLSYFQGTAGISSGDTIGFHFGTATAGSSALQINGGAGYTFIAGSVRSPLFYYSGDTSYYWQPGQSSAHRLGTPYGYLDLGPMNSSYCHFQTDRPTFYFNTNVDVNGQFRIYADTANRFQQGALVLRSASPTIYFRDTDENSAMLHCNSNLLYVLRGGNDSESWSAINGVWPQYWNLTNNYTYMGGTSEARDDFRAPIFYDSSNTAYYIDGNSESRLYRLRVGPYAGSTSSDNVTGLEIINTGGTGDSNVAAISFHCSNYYGTHLHLRSDGYFGAGGWSASTWRWYCNMSTGDFTAAGNVTAYSDPRLKENIRPIEGALEKVRQLNGVTFNWRENSVVGKPGARDYGLLSTDVEKVAPELVIQSAFEAPEGDFYKTVAYDKVAPILIEAIKEQDILIDKQRRENEELRASVEELKAKMIEILSLLPR